MTSPVPTIPNAFRVVLEQTYLGEQIANVLGVVTSTNTVPTSSLAEDVANAVCTSWQGSVMAVQNNGLRHDRTVAYSLEDPSIVGEITRSQVGQFNLSDSGDFGRVSGALAANVGLLTGRRGRRYRGRTGLAGLVESNVSGNRLENSYQVAIKVAFDEFLEDVRQWGNGEYDLAVVSMTYGLATPVTACQVQSLLGTRIARLR